MFARVAALCLRTRVHALVCTMRKLLCICCVRVLYELYVYCIYSRKCACVRVPKRVVLHK